MQFLRNLKWIAAAVAFVVLIVFLAMNWPRKDRWVPLNLWPLDDGRYLHVEWPVGLIALIFFLLGFVPMWLFNRTSNWRLNRRISALEQSIRITATAEPADENKPEAKDETRPEGPHEP